LHTFGHFSNPAIKAEIADLLLASLPINFFCVDKNGYLIECNDRLMQLSKVETADQILNKHLLELATPEAWANCQTVMTTNTSLTLEETHIEPDGTEQIFLSIKSPMHDESGDVIGVIGIGIDITEKKIAEKQAILANQIAATAEMELRRAVTVLAGSIAHDLRTPLASLNIISDLLDRSLSDVEEKNHILLKNNITEKSKELIPSINKLHEFPVKLKNIINDMNGFIDVTLKSMKRVNSGNLTKEDYVECDIESCITEAISKYPFNGNEKALINFNVIDNFSFIGCPLIFYRILFNLINNSLQQINKNNYGEIFITIGQKNDMNYLSFKDTAGGASSEIAKQLFTGYKTTKKTGTGIGLAFCKLAIESFGGSITCHSIEGEYIEFILSFSLFSNKQ
jgi:PAS domain S-box-containing protein